MRKMGIKALRILPKYSINPTPAGTKKIAILFKRKSLLSRIIDGFTALLKKPRNNNTIAMALPGKAKGKSAAIPSLKTQREKIPASCNKIFMGYTSSYIDTQTKFMLQYRYRNETETLMIRKNLACCFTGHRIIAREFRETLPQKLELQIRRLIDDGTADFITGGARGFDTLAAQTILKLRGEYPHIRLVLALPCKDQTKGWSVADKATYDSICNLADMVHYTGTRYTLDCMMRRNRFMVDNSSSCIFYLTNQRSGTYKTVSYAMEQGRNLYNILTVK